MATDPKTLFETARVGLEYEALIKVTDKTLWDNFGLANDENVWNASGNPGVNEAEVKYVITYLKSRGTTYDEVCKSISKFRKKSTPSLIKRNILCKLFNEQIINNKSSVDNKHWFQVADGYKKQVCQGPPLSVTPPALTDDIDNKFTWVITHDSSVVEEDETEQVQLLQNMEMVSPPLKVVESWDNISFMISNVFKNEMAWVSRHNIKTSNHVHFTLCDPTYVNHPTKPIWIYKPEALYDMCMAWWHFEPVFMMLCADRRRSNHFCASMHRSIIDRHEEESFGSNGNPADYLYKIFTANNDEHGHKMDAVLRELTPTTKQFKRQLEEAWYADGDFFNAADVNNENSALYKLMQIIYFFQGHPGEHDSRYASLNLLNTITHVTTIESRLYEGSTDPKAVMSWINLVVLFFSHYSNLNNIGDEMQNICWHLNEFMYYLDWDDVYNEVEITDTDEQGIQSLNEIIRAFDYMMTSMGVATNTQFYTYWKNTLTQNIMQVFTNKEGKEAAIKEMFAQVVVQTPNQSITPTQSILEAPFNPPPPKAGGKKDQNTYVFVYGLDKIKDIAKQLGIKRIKKELVPQKATLPKHKLKQVNTIISITKDAKSSIQGTVIALTKEQLSHFKAIKQTTLMTKDVTIDCNGQIVRCRVASKIQVPALESMKEKQRQPVKSK